MIFGPLCFASFGPGPSELRGSAVTDQIHQSQFESQETQATPSESVPVHAACRDAVLNFAHRSTYIRPTMAVKPYTQR
jgi:hypothetical protein